MSLGVFVSCGFMSELEVLALAPEIERLGFDGMTLPDHLITAAAADVAYPYSPDGRPPFRDDTPWPDPLVMIGALGPLTKTLRFVTSVYVLPLRQPVIAAKAAATAARLCGGRLTLGVGAGWRRDEFDVVGMDFSRRGAMTSEAIGVLRTLWRPGPVEHSGRSFSFGPLRMEPTPPPIPIAVGGMSDAALRRAAQLADAYLMPTQPLAEIGTTLERLGSALAREGRTEGSIEIFISAFAARANEILAILQSAIDNVILMPWPHPGTTRTSTAEKLAHLRRCAAEVLTPLRDGAAA